MCAIFNFTNFINECMFFSFKFKPEDNEILVSISNSFKENLTNSYLNQITYQIFFGILFLI